MTRDSYIVLSIMTLWFIVYCTFNYMDKRIILLDRGAVDMGKTLLARVGP